MWCRYCANDCEAIYIIIPKGCYLLLAVPSVLFVSRDWGGERIVMQEKLLMWLWVNWPSSILSLLHQSNRLQLIAFPFMPINLESIIRLNRRGMSVLYGVIIFLIVFQEYWFCLWTDVSVLAYLEIPCVPKIRNKEW